MKRKRSPIYYHPNDFAKSFGCPDGSLVIDAVHTNTLTKLSRRWIPWVFPNTLDGEPAWDCNPEFLAAHFAVRNHLPMDTK